MNKYIITTLWGLFVWFIAIMFFVIFGEYVLFNPGTNSFVISSILLIAGTAISLLLVTFLYMKFDKSENSTLRFGIIGTMVGLILDTFSLANHPFLFPNLTESQIVAFAVWMSFAYALYLLIPLIFHKNNKRRIASQ
ncbi:DUF5367 family protein [Brevibacillus daliensis]|uniref:DUF5367 family protein n=1 Tax=Brevibacillus daliensis TaxID=2892995 RepID=UPI001E3513DA|nr:DUF5367 family protein [Brevibacillus daliensis]